MPLPGANLGVSGCLCGRHGGTSPIRECEKRCQHCGRHDSPSGPMQYFQDDPYCDWHCWRAENGRKGLP